MKLETFFEKFEQFTDAPNAVAKMRELVLGFAVRGHLVEQDPNDEPAPELLKQIYAAKSARRFCTESGEGEDPTANSDRYPFVIPKSWQWVGATTPAVIISEVGKKVQTKDVLPEGTYPVVDQGKVFIRGYCNDPEKVIKVTEPIVLFGDHTRETKLIDFDFVVGADGVKLLQPLCIDPLYYFLALRWLPLDSRGYGRHFKLLRASYIPLPPLAEQKRIVAKVDELMALCDRLETQQQERDTRYATLAHASLTRFADTPTPANLNLLFHPSYAIAPADLRKTILALAVQGKLVPQNPKDEPATIVLAQIQAERRAAKEERRMSAMKIYLPAELDELGFELPPGWEIARICELLMGIQTGPFGSSLHKSDYKHGGTPVINPASLKDGKIVPIDKMAVGTETVERLVTFKLRAGDIVMARRGEMGRCAVITEHEQGWLCGTGSLVLRIPNAIHARYLDILIGSPDAREYLGGACVGTTMQNLNQSILSKMVVGVPPLAEQRRIVAKVDQLMALVDQLETQLTASRAAATNLMEAVVAELTAQE